MGLLEAVLILAVIGFLLWAFNTYATAIDSRIKWIINALVIIAVIVWVLNLFGIFAHDIPVPRVR